jgi:hypothetical protein
MICEQNTIHGALFNDLDTYVVTPQLLWAKTLNLWASLCEPEFVHVHVMHTSMRSSVHVVSRQARKLLYTAFSTCFHNCTSICILCAPGRL